MFVGDYAVSFTKIFTPSGRIFLEFVANDLPLFFRKNTLNNGVRASFKLRFQNDKKFSYS
ncbi:hypothetical protein SDC9_204910 [bioreactor metagenome]|uniref:Uncharacterized protein n=1 Tax=bioreactor metagenome TaxID=1076179 RepID=A0A645J185_9ZZZZ